MGDARALTTLLDDVARAASFSKVATYHYFGGGQRLFDAVVGGIIVDVEELDDPSSSIARNA